MPAGWLTFAEGVVYKHYNEPVRVWDLSPTEDQQLAGAIMKVGGSIFLWALVVFYFFRRFAPTWKEDNTYRRKPLTFEQVQIGVRQCAGARGADPQGERSQGPAEGLTPPPSRPTQ